ncbi:MAG: hypothetical protein K0U29_06625 [Gammaproteobacteria bacterium]|nr:hypothetical protein [Gammaproteobacteria bacterium]
MPKNVQIPEAVTQYIAPRDHIHTLVKFTQGIQFGKRVPGTATLTISLLIPILRLSALPWPNLYFDSHRFTRFSAIIYNILNLSIFYFYPSLLIKKERKIALDAAINTIHGCYDIRLLYYSNNRKSIGPNELTALKDGMQLALQLNQQRLSSEPAISEANLATLTQAQKIHNNLQLISPAYSPESMNKTTNIFNTVIYMGMSLGIFMEFMLAEFVEDQYDTYSILFTAFSLYALTLNYLITKKYAAKNFECIEHQTSEEINVSIREALDFAPFADQFFVVNEARTDSITKVLNVRFIKQLDPAVAQHLQQHLHGNGITIIAAENKNLFISANTTLTEEQIEGVRLALNKAHSLQNVIRLTKLVVKDYIQEGSFLCHELNDDNERFTITFSLQDSQKADALLQILKDQNLTNTLTEDHGSCTLSIPFNHEERIQWRRIFDNVDRLFHPERYTVAEGGAAPAPVEPSHSMADEIARYEQQKNHRPKKSKKHWWDNLAGLFAPAAPANEVATITFDHNGNTETFDPKNHPDQFQVIKHDHTTVYAYFPEDAAINREQSEAFRKAFEKGFSARHNAGIVHDDDGQYKIKLAKKNARVWENPGKRSVASDGSAVIVLDVYVANGHTSRAKHNARH